MGQAINYNVDQVRIEKIGIKRYKIYITGWAFCEGQYEAMNIEIKGVNDGTIKKSTFDREDVYEAFGRLDEALKSGFDISIITKTKYKALELFFSMPNIGLSEYCSVTLPKIEKRKSFTAENLKKFFGYVKKKGFFYAVKKAILKLLDIHDNIGSDDTPVYQFEELSIPEEWIRIQRYKPKISAIVPVFGALNQNKYLDAAIESFRNQTYTNFEVIMVGQKTLNNSKYNDISIKEIQCNKSDDKSDMVIKALSHCTGEYVTVIEQEDIISKNIFAHFIEEINQDRSLKLVIFNEDRFIDEEDYFCPIMKREVYDSDIDFGKLAVNAAFYARDMLKSLKSYDQANIGRMIEQIKIEEIKFVDKIVYHKRVVQDLWNEKDKVKAIAFYLPQFHAIPENDKWWGKGFTEWTNTKRAYPMFKGHFQPRIPHSDLGYYNLVEDKDIQLKQAKLAKKYNIYGFCYYYYWFNGKRLLEKPLDQVLNNKTIDLPFCICWANENWSRRWDGLESEVLMAQTHDDNTDEKFIKDVIPILKDDRYIRIGGAPLLIIYRADLFKNMKKTVDKWREICKSEGIPEIHLSFVQSFGLKDPIPYGGDSAIEFPPHNINTKIITTEVDGLAAGFSGNIYSYSYLANTAVNVKESGYKQYRGCMLQWDNTARKMDKAHIFHEFSIKDYMKWLYKCCEYTRYINRGEDRFVFINAWNEWAEGTYLEPDSKNGYLYLDSTSKIMNSR